ncbi:hypothetical protein [Vulcanisaeta distributa]|uniref:hypothetical protein n=1 Tax=Vulcanisaeta distributa TaxID=164451 RepID=UPI000AB6065F|nr:hypothetical protein [Vulcanisaeta distributa]
MGGCLGVVGGVGLLCSCFLSELRFSCVVVCWWFGGEFKGVVCDAEVLRGGFCGVGGV